MEADLIQRENIPFRGIPAAGIHGVGLKTLPGNILRLVRGISASRKIVKDFKPDVLLFTGGYVAAPMAIAAGRIPSMLFVPDIEPGLALKFLARNASCIALTTETSREYFSSSKRLEVTGYPLRPDLANWDREKAAQHLGLDASTTTLLIFGGSKGARSINNAVMSTLPELLKICQVVHITGSLDWNTVQTRKAELSADQAGRYHIYEYMHEMGAALACADLVVSRAGASTLGELPFFGLPAILVPYPYAWRYQKVNADYLVDRNAAVLLENSELTDQLLPLIRDLLGDQERLNRMKQAMLSLARPQAAQRIADLICELANPQKRGAL